MARSGMQPVYIGDIGVIVEHPERSVVLPDNLDLSGLTFRQLCNLALACGFDVKDVIGISKCVEHENMVFVGGGVLPFGYNLFDDCNYCKNCWRLFRIKYKKVEHDNGQRQYSSHDDTVLPESRVFNKDSYWQIS